MKNLIKGFLILFSSTSLIFLGFMLKQTMDFSPQLAEQLGRFTGFLSANLVSLMGLLITVVVSNEQEKKEKELIYEELIEAGNEEKIISGRLIELMNSIIYNPKMAQDDNFKNRLKVVFEETIENGSKADKLLMKLLKKQLRK